MPISQSDSFLFASLLLDTRNPGSEETKKSEGRKGSGLRRICGQERKREYSFSRITVCAKGEGGSAPTVIAKSQQSYNFMLIPAAAN